MLTGKIKWFNPTKGYGFILPDNNDADIFLHISNIDRQDVDLITEDQVVSYEVGDNRGKKTAINVKVVAE